MRTLSVSLRFKNYKFEPLKIFSSLAVLPFQTFAILGHKNRTKKSRKSCLFQCFHSGQNFWLRPEILAFFLKKPEQGQKKPEKGQNFAKRPEFYTISHKRSPKKARILQKGPKFIQSPKIQLQRRTGHLEIFDFVWKKLANFQEKRT